MTSDQTIADSDHRELKQISELPPLDIFSAEYTADPVGVLHELGRQAPLAASNAGVFVLEADLIDQALRDRRLGMNWDAMIKANQLSDPRTLRVRRDLMTSRNGADHTRLRSAVGKFFAPAAVEKYRPVVREIIDDLLREAASIGRPFDFYADVCEHVPARLFCRLVEMPEGRAPFVTRMSNSIIKIFFNDPANKEEIESAYREIFDYIEELMAERRGNLGDDLLSDLIRLQDEGKLSEQEIFDLTALLIEASTDNTANEMAMVVAALLEHPESFAEIRANPEIVRNAISEGIRWYPRALLIKRHAVDDYELAGVAIPKGTDIWFPTLVSLRSAERYPNPEVFDIHREHRRSLQTFGGGAHRCLGAPLALLEIDEMIFALADTYPDVRLAGPLGFHPRGPYIQGIQSIPVELQPAVVAS